ncbi:MAG: Holliday junction branch migration protein RuvA [Evtepia sp.]
MGQEAKLYTHLNVREDAMELYGFATENEKNCFQMLISVSGVGPKAALSILSANTPEGLATAIITGNEKALTVAPGVGKKIAQRVLLELKDKLAKGQLPAAGESYGGSGADRYSPGQDLGGHRRLGRAGLWSRAEINLALSGLDLDGPVPGGHRAPGR